MNADNLYHRGFEPLLERPGLSGFTFHSLRHTSATNLLSKNGNSKIVSKVLHWERSSYFIGPPSSEQR